MFIYFVKEQREEGVPVDPTQLDVLVTHPSINNASDYELRVDVNSESSSATVSSSNPPTADSKGNVTADKLSTETHL